MPLTADPFAQLRLLDVARLDQVIGAAEHRRRTLPELASIDTGTRAVDDLEQRAVLARTEVGDLDAATRKLDAEVDAVRARAARDAERLAAGSVPAKDLANLQHEIVSLQRRQSVLEDEELELMERRETAAATVVDVESQLDRAAADLAAARDRRDDAFADIDDELARARAERAQLTTTLPADVLALYERVRGSGRVAAAGLHGSRCEACRIDLDRVALNEIHGAAADVVLRCPECGAILIRT